ncbi:MAG TPA: hypothetical protein VFR32_03440, partial [Gaiellaceae bacterium]|nr:hypothetical protein [Gaiellaceae bacterium]
MLGPGQTFAHTFRAPGMYGYADGGFGKYRGRVTVGGAAAATLAAGRETVTFGSRVRLSGDVAGARSGERVAIFAKRFGAASFSRVGVATTAAGGAWSYRAKPVVSTTFRARAGGAWSGPVTVGVRPLVTFSARDGALSTSVSAARSLAGRFVVLQRRLAGGVWVAVKRVVLADEGAEFRAQLPPGRSVLRIVFPRSQAGPGYLPGISRTLAVTG